MLKPWALPIALCDRPNLKYICAWLIIPSDPPIASYLMFKPQALPIVICDRPDLKYIFAMVNNASGSTISHRVLHINADLFRLWFVNGEADPKYICVAVNSFSGSAIWDFPLKTRTTTFYQIHKKTWENSRLDHKAALQKLCTRAYNYCWIRSLPLHISHGFYFRRLPIVISNMGEVDPKYIYIYILVNDTNGSSRLQCTLHTSLGLRWLQYAMGSGLEINMRYG